MNKLLFVLAFVAFPVLSLSAIEYKHITVSKPGTLQTQMDVYELIYERNLAIKGRLNSSDMKAIRNWHNGRYDYLALDLSEAEIISGGDPYYEDYTTEEDVIGPYMFWKCGFKELILPKTLKGIGDFALSEAVLMDSLELPETLEFIGDRAFWWCEFHKIHIPSRVTFIGDGALGFPFRVTSLTVAEDNPSFEVIDSVLYTKDHTRLLLYTQHTEDEGSSYNKNYTVLPTVKKIDSGAFHFKFVGYINLPEGLEEIGDYVFWQSLRYMDFYSSGLKELVLPQSLKKIGEYAFYYNRIQELVLPDDLEVIRPFTFSYSLIRKLHLPKHLKRVMYAGIGDGNIIEEMTLPDELERVDSLGFLNFAPPKLVIPRSLKVMEPLAFSYWFGDTLDIQAPLDSIPNRAFEGCQSVKKIIFPPTLKSIGEWAFTHCHELKSLDLPEGLERIGANAFGVHMLDTIRIPSTVKELGEKALYCNTWMGRCTYYVYPRTPPVCVRYTFGDLDFENCTLYVPKGCVEAYRNAHEWCLFGHILEMDASDINAITDTIMTSERGYSLNGHLVSPSYKGVKIIRDQKGKTRKTIQR